MISCLVNGELTSYVDARDRGLHYGDGLFETIAIVHGQPRFWQEHVDRLGKDCERLGLTLPPQEVLLREVHTASAGRILCVVKIIVTRGVGGRGYQPDDHGACTRLVAAYPWPADIDEQWESGVSARICKLRMGIQPALGGMKHLNRLEQVLASQELHGADVDTGILLDHDDQVICALSGNLFLVGGTQMLTPRLDRCGVRGVMRGAILRQFKSRCELRRVTPDMLLEADEVFLCNAVRGIVPVVNIDAHQWPIGPVTRELQQWLTGVMPL
ncbi:MAG: aminodeoxychorismate lyase [Gammaproteobacteria bacterium]|nr:aminodeoxychorismate lyase [Gammaproteobacteria bacterium]